MRARFLYLTQLKPKLLVLIALFISVLLFVSIYLWIFSGLYNTKDNFRHQKLNVDVLIHLDKLKSAILHIEKNEKPYLIAKKIQLVEDIKNEFKIAVDQTNQLKKLCDNHLFNCEDIYQLDSLVRRQIAFTSTVVEISAQGFPDSAIKILTGSVDNNITDKFIAKFDAIYQGGQKSLLNFQDNNNTTQNKIAQAVLIMLIFILIILLIVFANLAYQIKKKDKLLEQNIIFSKLIENSNQAISITNENHKIIYCNKATETLYKIKRSEFIGRPIDMGLSKNETKDALKEIKRALDEGSGWTGELERTDSNNNSIFVHLSINNIKNDKGKTIAHASITTDLTSLKKAQKKNEELNISLTYLNNELEDRVIQQTSLIKDVFERVTEVFIGTDKELNIIYANNKVSNIFNLNEEEVLHKKLPDLLYPILEQSVIESVKNSLSLHLSYIFQFLNPLNNRYFEASFYPSNKGVSMYFRDINESKKASDDSIKSKRIIQFTSNVNDLLISAISEKEIYQKICQIAVEAGGFLLAWVGMPEQLSGQINPVYWSDDETNYLSVVKTIKATGPSGIALRTGQYYCSNDISTDPIMEPWRKESILRGYHSTIALPIKLNDKVVSILVIHAAESFFFSEQEINLLIQVIENINFALDAFQTRDRRKKAVEEMNKLKQAIDQSSASIVITNLKGEIEYSNPIFTKLTGYTMDEIMGRNPRLLKSGYTPADNYTKLWTQLKKQQEWQGEFCNRKKNGELYWEYAVISPIINEEGVTTNYVAIKENITDRKILEREQMELVEIIETSYAFVYRADMNFKLSYANKAFKDIIEIGEEDITKYSIKDFIRGGESVFNNQVITLNETGKWIGESIIKSISGKSIPILQVMVLHKDHTGQPSHLSTTAINLSKIKEAEEELLRVNIELTDFARHLQNISEIERKEIARDIHDDLGQNLAVLNMKVAWIKKNLQKDPDVLLQKVVDLENSIKGTMKGFRRIHSALHPAMLEQLGLEATIKWLIQSIEEDGSIVIVFDCFIKTVELKLEISLPIYRVIQEAFTNIIKYSKATEAHINLSENANSIFLTIEDNGDGFIVNEVDTKLHHGILGMRERIYAVNGKYEIESTLGKGTKINVQLPIN